MSKKITFSVWIDKSISSLEVVALKEALSVWKDTFPNNFNYSVNFGVNLLLSVSCGKFDLDSAKTQAKMTAQSLLSVGQVKHIVILSQQFKTLSFIQSVHMRKGTVGRYVECSNSANSFLVPALIYVPHNLPVGIRVGNGVTRRLRAELKSTYIHEFGHALGLKHIENKAGIMHSSINNTNDKQTTLHSSDLIEAKRVLGWTPT